MTDLSNRIRENLLTDPRGLDLLGGRTSLLREAADALDARDAEVEQLRAEVRRLKRIIYLYCDPTDMRPEDSLVVDAICTEMDSALPDEETPEDE